MKNEDLINIFINKFNEDKDYKITDVRDREKLLDELRPTGEWIHRHIITKDRSFDMVVCSNCHTEFSWDAETGVSMDNYKTCPNCGAKMKKEAENEQ